MEWGDSFWGDSFWGNETAQDYGAVASDLLPYGPAWNRASDSYMQKLLSGLGIEMSRVEAAAALLVEESDYRTTELLLGEWEAFAGLPTCPTPVAQSLSERQSALHAKLTQNTSPRPSTFQALAEGLGYTGVVVLRSEAAPFTPGSVVGDSLRGGPWHHAWSITTNESLSVDALLRCLVGQLAPQHATIIFNLGTVGI